MSSKKCKTKIRFLGRAVVLLSFTEGMDCWSFSTPAGESCPMIRADDASYVCHGCYAQLNRYNMPNVLDAQWVRYLWTKDCLRSPEGQAVWIATMTEAIRKEGGTYFRGHDSGDFFHPEYVRMWTAVARNLPAVRFWFPTRNWPHSGQMGAKWVEVLTEFAALPNVVVRPSGLRYDDPAPVVPWLSDGSTVVSTVQEAERMGMVLCPKTIHHGSCESNGCRECWNPGHAVAYLVHGSLGRSVAANAQSPKIVALRAKAKASFTALTLSAKG